MALITRQFPVAA
jgi:uncharacterized membrane protein HdeD (DUF308 family)